MPQGNKKGRMNEDLRREIIGIIGTMKDPRLQSGLLTVLRVEAAPDLSSAKVYVSMLGKDVTTADAVACLKKAAGHIRTEVSRRMHIRRSPELLFVADDSPAYAAHINEIIKELDKDEH